VENYFTNIDTHTHKHIHTKTQQHNNNNNNQKPEVLVKTTSRRIGSSDEDTSDVTVRDKPATVSPAFTRPYMYESSVDDDNTKRKFEPYGVGFRYEGRSSEQSQPPTSPSGKIIDHLIGFRLLTVFVFVVVVFFMCYRS